MKTSDLLICVPCFNSEDTITDVVESLLQHTDADLLLIDDLSDRPLVDVIRQHFGEVPERIEIRRPEEKVYCGGAKNLGMRRAMDEGYDYVIALDSDVIVPPGLDTAVRQFFAESPEAVVVAPAILPAGTPWQYTDTLINFSKFLPDRRQKVSQRAGLAGYAFALNVRVLRRRPCFHEARFGGEDVLFFQQLAERFGLSSFPVMNLVPVIHLPPRARWEHAQHAQQRYGQSFFTHADRPRERIFMRQPWLHYLTPRWWLMLTRVVRRRRWSDLRYAGHAWFLDLARARHIVRLHSQGYRDPTVAALSTDLPKIGWQDPAPVGTLRS